jgi:hypothetical protein
MSAKPTLLDWRITPMKVADVFSTSGHAVSDLGRNRLSR